MPCILAQVLGAHQTLQWGDAASSDQRHWTTFLEELFEQLAKAQDAPLRHLWLRSVVDWLRGTDARVPQVLARLDQLRQRLQDDAALHQQVSDLWQAVEEDLDLASVLAEFGFAGRGMFLAELGHRLMSKWLPASPVTRGAADLSALVFHDLRDAT